MSVKWIFSFLLIFSVCILNGCTTKEINPPSKKQFFDLKGFFEGEIERLEASSFELIKIVDLSGLEESKSIKADEISWQSELSPFVNSDINKVALYEKYEEIDSVSDGGNSILIYRTTDRSLKVQFMRLVFDAGDSRPKSIEIHIGKKNFLMKSSTKLRYLPEEGFIISGEQKIMLQKLSKFSVEANFQPS